MSSMNYDYFSDIYADSYTNAPQFSYMTQGPGLAQMEYTNRPMDNKEPPIIPTSAYNRPTGAAPILTTEREAFMNDSKESTSNIDYTLILFILVFIVAWLLFTKLDNLMSKLRKLKKSIKHGKGDKDDELTF